MESDLRHSLLEYLAQHNTLTLATAGEDGPAAAALFYVSDDALRLFFLSEAHAAHARNLQRDPRVAATVQEDYRDWRQIQGLQIRGSARALGPGLEAAGALRRYLAKYPFLEAFLPEAGTDSSGLAAKLVGSRFHVIEPLWLRWIDNPAGFGRRREYDLMRDVEVSVGR